ncbi:hypothetical protein HWV62_30479 [Athelia sp. TMB]|nr:hypothetical protein HWV62_30479 [Athelia sp. TMB]
MSRSPPTAPAPTHTPTMAPATAPTAQAQGQTPSPMPAPRSPPHPHPHPHSSPQQHHPASAAERESNAQLAKLLSSSYREIDALRRELESAARRADRAEKILAAVSTQSSDPNAPTNGLPDQTVRTIMDFEARALAAEEARDKSEAGKRALAEHWAAFVQRRRERDERDAEDTLAMARVVEAGGGVVVPLASLSMPPPLPRFRREVRPHASQTWPLPSPGSSGSLRRPRAGSMDEGGGYLVPPAKRPRNDRSFDAQYPTRPVDPRMAAAQSQAYPPPPPHAAHARGNSGNSFPQPYARPHHVRARSFSRSPSPDAREISMRDGRDPRDGRDRERERERERDRDRDRERDRESAHSDDIDGLLLEAASDPHHAHHRDRDHRYSPPSRASTHQGVIPGAPPAHAAPLSQPGLVATYQTHIFAPPVTGAPTKKTSLPPAPSAPQAAGVQGGGGFPPQNAQGQRICRQCGLPGRYKDGKCVEKWGPGPEGPGTVCDRCRKKMKRVERRGTLESQQSLAHAQQAALRRTDTLPARAYGPGGTQLLSPAPSAYDRERYERDRDQRERERERGEMPAIATLDEDAKPRRPGSAHGHGHNNGHAHGHGNGHGHGHAAPRRSPLAHKPGTPGMDVDDADADGDAEPDVEDADADEIEVDAEAGGDDAEGEVVDGEDADAGEDEAVDDADLELLEAVDAAEANSSAGRGTEDGDDAA